MIPALNHWSYLNHSSLWLLRYDIYGSLDPCLDITDNIGSYSLVLFGESVLISPSECVSKGLDVSSFLVLRVEEEAAHLLPGVLIHEEV